MKKFIGISMTVLMTVAAGATNETPEYMLNEATLKPGFGRPKGVERVILDSEEALRRKQLHEDMTVEALDRVGGVERRATRLEARASRIEATNRRQDEEIGGLKYRTGVLEYRADRNDARDDQQDGRLNIHEGRLNNHEWRLGTAERTIQDHGHRIGTVEGTVRRHEYQIGSLRYDLNVTNYNVGSLQRQTNGIDQRLREGYYGTVPEHCRTVTVRRRTNLVDSVAFTRTPVLTGLLPGNASVQVIVPTTYKTTFTKTGMLNVKVSYTDPNGQSQFRTGFISADDVYSPCLF